MTDTRTSRPYAPPQTTRLLAPFLATTVSTTIPSPMPMFLGLTDTRTLVREFIVDARERRLTEVRRRYAAMATSSWFKRAHFGKSLGVGLRVDE